MCGWSIAQRSILQLAHTFHPAARTEVLLLFNFIFFLTFLVSNFKSEATKRRNEPN